CPTPTGPVEQPYLADALEQFTTAQPVVVQLVKGHGSPLGLDAVSTPSYAHDIAPLLQAKCITCHRSGDIGSWAMTNHAIVAQYAAPIREDILIGSMPPWHADPGAGTFANDSSLTPAEAAQLLAWLDAGAQRGDGEDPLVTHPPPPVLTWPLGQPDLILSIPKQSIPADGLVDYRYLPVPNPLTSNVWLRAATVRPGNRQVVHHSLVFSASTVDDFLQVQGGLGGFFAGYVPGMDVVEFPAGTGKLLKKGSYLVFQMHYTTTGTAATDQTQIGLYFAKTPPASELITSSAYTTNFTIPPNVRDQEIVAETTLARDSVLYELSPHMHYRGHRMRIEAVYADNSTETLLNVPGYQFAWQSLYRLAEPKALPAGTVIRVTAGYDNSIWNPSNPDPFQSVYFGEQTADEMLIGYLNITQK
ncbi:MAG TPA: cytochrome c, partial [Candidatus Limnocylindria bacterium]|nr:cytochrome c [Candidatus Limnocylindria bacterium]